MASPSTSNFTVTTRPGVQQPMSQKSGVIYTYLIPPQYLRQPLLVLVMLNHEDSHPRFFETVEGLKVVATMDIVPGSPVLEIGTS